ITSPTTPGLITTSATAPMSTAVAALPTRLTPILLPTTKLPTSARRSRPTRMATAQTGSKPRIASTTATLESIRRSATGSRIRPIRVGPVLLASLPSRKSVAAASTKKAAAIPSDPPSSSVTTTGTMKSLRNDRALGTVKTRSPSPLASSVPGITLTAALNPYPYAYPPQIITFSERVLHVAHVPVGDILGPAREEGEPRGGGAGLGSVADLDTSGRGGASDELAQELGDLVRRDAEVVRSVEPGCEGQDLAHPGAGERRNGDHRRLEVGHSGEKLTFYLPYPLLRHEVALVYQDATRRACLLYLACDPEVPGHQPVDRVHQQHRDLGAPDGLGRPQGGVVRHAAHLARPPAHPGGVEDEVALRLAVYPDLDLAGDRVRGGARHLRDDRPLGAEQAVEERALAHVRPTDDREPRQPVLLVRLRLREEGGHLVEQVPDPNAVQSRDRVRLALAQRVEPVALGVVGGVVELVDREDDLPPRPPQLARDRRVGLRRSHPRVHEVHDHVRLLDGDLGLQRHERLQPDLHRGLHPPSIHQHELPARPLGAVVPPVARGPRLVRDHRPATTEDAVDQRTLADVGRPDHRNDREPAHPVPPALSSGSA